MRIVIDSGLARVPRYEPDVGLTRLETEGLVAGYTAELDILNDVSIAVAAGEIVTVVGPNGAGKSTLMKAVIGLVAPRRGRVLLRGSEIGELFHGI